MMLILSQAVGWYCFYAPPGMTGGTLCFRDNAGCLSFRPSMPFQQIIMHALQCQHDVDVHLLFCFDLDLHITSSRGRV